jgi:hypothetical protein
MIINHTLIYRLMLALKVSFLRVRAEEDLMIPSKFAGTEESSLVCSLSICWYGFSFDFLN